MTGCQWPVRPIVESAHYVLRGAVLAPNQSHMLSVGAYSFRQKSRLAVSLSWVAGYTNAVTFVMLGAVVVAHVTGHVTQAGLAAGKGLTGWLQGGEHWSVLGEVGLVVLVVGMFFAGAVASAAMIEFGRSRKNPRRFTTPIAVEAVLLGGLALGIALYYAGVIEIRDSLHEVWMAAVAAAAMGLQNATVTRISGAVIRPTHLTGVVTDLGLELVNYLVWVRARVQGHRDRIDAEPHPGSADLTWTNRLKQIWTLSRRHPSFQRLALLGSVFTSFLFGAAAGTVALVVFPAAAMALPVAFLIWIFVADRRRAVAEVKELDPAVDPEIVSHLPLDVVPPPQLGVYRLTHHRRHDPPDFVAWVDALPEARRVLLLILSPLTRLDANAALNLAAAIKRLRSDRRDLVLAGVAPSHHKVLNRYGLFASLSADHVAGNVRPALSHALSLASSPAADRPASEAPALPNPIH